jgi:predicted RNA binding protein YcfA (HicA-like mRNA interferase family)
MKLPRGVSAGRLIRTLKQLGYDVIRQKGSHVRLLHPGPPAHTMSDQRRDLARHNLPVLGSTPRYDRYPTNVSTPVKTASLTISGAWFFGSVGYRNQSTGCALNTAQTVPNN